MLDFAAGVESKCWWPLWSWRPAVGMMGLSLVLTLAAAGIYSDAASALDAIVVTPTPSAKWCLEQRDGNSDRLACHENLITCVVAAFTHASWCTQRVPATLGAMNRHAPSVTPVPRRRTRAASTQHKLTAAERDDLYHAFEKWNERSRSE